jgi:hypothetical protein
MTFLADDSNSTLLLADDDVSQLSDQTESVLLNSFRFYLEGVLLTPVSIFGLLGKKNNIIKQSKLVKNVCKNGKMQFAENQFQLHFNKWTASLIPQGFFVLI